jgi:hypothetical protein
MVTTMIQDHAARRHSYELLAQAFGEPGPAGAGGSLIHGVPLLDGDLQIRPTDRLPHSFARRLEHVVREAKRSSTNSWP